MKQTSKKTKQDSDEAFVLHCWPYRETSTIVEIFSRNYGRISLVARGARRPKSALSNALHPFQPLHLTWRGESSLRNLYRAEWLGGLPQLSGMALICGFYLNELLMKLLHKDDPHETLYLSYRETLLAIGLQTDSASILRRFEKQLLKDLGYAMTLEYEVEYGRPIETENTYIYVADQGPILYEGACGNENRLELSGKTLLDIAKDEYRDPVTQQQSKALMRMLISHHLGNQVLHSRQLLRDLQQI